MDELYHFGIKGQKWGIRRYQNTDGSLTSAGKKRYGKKTYRKASKDAKEYARAKMFYGEGAGTRRKLIKAKVEERSKDPQYKQAFDDAMSKQNMSKHASKAKTERRIKDTKNTVTKTGRGLVNITTGHPERVGATLAAAAAVYGVAHRAGIDKIVANMAKTKIKDLSKHAASAYSTVKQWGLR